ncbi:lycopene cyclase domain-containing protein [Tenacibaculum xiamenense]|uniref:lycopene cyclase domain-containing protein n=1 Tax=Tenacibaculum xiamenense TaxID=1261553 RepID=UPI0038952FAB
MVNNYLYLILNIGSLSIPLLYSIFEKEFHFIKHFKYALLSILTVAIPFLIWDALFTSAGVWGFNSDYHVSLLILNMPIEEWMFFFCIPYACLFTHEVLKYYLPNFKLSKQATLWISLILLTLIAVLLIMNFGKWYTTVNFSFFLVLLIYSLKYYKKELAVYFPSFLVILVPFFIVNGILTGSFIEEPVVWYNNNENLSFRLFTIPFEDIFYAFNLLFSIQLVFNYLKNRSYVE